MRLCTIASATLALLGANSALAHGQHHALVVSVADIADGRPLAGADVHLVGTSRTGRTDWIGEARFLDLPALKQHVQVRMLGYAPAELEIPITGDSSGAIFMLEAVAHPLDQVDVTARKVDQRFAEFELHRRIGIGRFL